MIVLRYLLGYPTGRIARFMSLDDRTRDKGQGARDKGQGGLREAP